MRHTEPKQAVKINGVTFEPTDIKALLAEIYLAADFLFLGGDRCEFEKAPNQNSADEDLNQNVCEDINPGTFHAIIGNWIGLRKQIIIMDEAYDSAIWNFPVYHYASGSRSVTRGRGVTGYWNPKEQPMSLILRQNSLNMLKL